MNDNYHAGRLITLTLYMGAGILSTGSCIIAKLYGGVISVVLFTWLVGFFLLLFLNERRGVKPYAYCMVYNTLLAALTVGYCFTFHNSYLILFGFFVECMSCILFLELKACNHMLAINMCMLVFFTFYPKTSLEKYQRVSEAIATAAVYVVCTWIAAVLIKLVQKRDRRNNEQAQSLDDLLAVVESKCDDAQNANRAKSDFLARMSHEIRTPINAVLGLDTMILRESREAHVKNYAMDIQNEGQILLSLINDILDLSKIESGKLEISPAEYELSSLLNDVYNMVYFKAVEKELELKFNIDENLPTNLFGDDVRIRQILVNILSNAVKYTEQGSVTLSVNGDMDDNAVILSFSISDTGIGIKKEDLGRLFSEYERIEDVRTRYIEGTGLGMSITMRLLDMMDSKLLVESEYGVGSTFSFDIRQPVMSLEPIGNLEERIKNKTVSYEYAASFTAPEKKVLVVDDNAVNRKVFMNLLKETKINITEAEDGYKCLELVKKDKYDIIFLDHMMPGIDGIETLKEIRAMKACINADTPIIALTANAVSGAREMYLAEGFDDFMTKPIKPDRLESMICEKLGIMTRACAVKEEQSTTEIGRRLMGIDGIDWDYAVANLGSEGLIVDTARDFCRACESERKTLQEQLKHVDDSQEDMELFRIKVHSMKTTAAMIGNIALSGVAKMLEYAARDGKKDVLNAVTPVFLESWSAFGEELRNIFPEFNSKEKKPINHELIRGYLCMLVNSIQDMEIDTADEIMVQLKGFKFPETMSEVIEQLESAVSNIDEGLVIELTNQLLKELEDM